MYREHYANTKNEGFFGKMRRKLSNAFARTMAHVIHFGSGTYSNRLAGRALFGHRDRLISPQEWLFRLMRGNVQPAGKPRPGVEVDTYGAMQREQKRLRRRKRINYSKLNNRIARAMRQFNGEPSTPFAPRQHQVATRDALTGIVS